MSDVSNEFKNLQTLLKMKQHELPPPGYFNNFSSIVINQIEREERQRANRQNSFFVKCLSFLETNPMTAGLFGVGVCGLLALGVTFSQERAASDYANLDNLSVDVASNGILGGSAKNGHSDVSASLDPVFGGGLSGSLSSGLDRLAFQPVNLSIGH